MLAILKKNWFSLATFILTTGLLFVAMSFGGGLKNIINALENIRLIWIVFALGLIFIYWMLDAVILHILALTKKRTHKFSSSFVTSIFGFLGNAITPFSTGGQPLQIYELNKSGIGAGVASAIITWKSLIYQVSMLAYAIVCSVFTWKLFDANVEHFGLYMLFGVICNFVFIGAVVMICISKRMALRIALAFAFILHKIRIVKNFYRTSIRTCNQIRLFRKSMASAGKQYQVSIICTLLSFIQLSLLFSIPYMIYRAFDLSGSSLLYMLFANSLIYMITSFVPLPGSTGAAEGSFYLFFRMFFPLPLLIPAIVLWRAVTYYSCIFFGMGVSLFEFLLRQKVKPKITQGR